jgi:hypothetical protein
MRAARVIAAIILVPLAVVLIALSVANRHPVSLSLDPFNGTTPAVEITAPLYIILFATAAIGIVIGGVGVWLGQGRWRRQARSLKRETRTLRRENEQFRTSASPSPASSLPAPRRGAA